MTPTLGDVRARLERAREHYVELQHVFDGIRLPDAGIEPILERLKESRHQIRCRVRPPVRLQILLGDVIHNLRVSLDYLCCQLVRLEGHHCNTSDFPIYLDAKRFAKEGGRRIQKLVGAQAFGLIEQVQPFHADNPPSDLLWHLYRLDNIQKHRFLTVVSPRLGLQEVRLSRDRSDLQYTIKPNEDPLPLADGAILMDFNLPPAFVALGSGHIQMEFKVKLGFEFADTDGLCDGVLVMSRLDAIRVRVMEVMRLFEHELFPPQTTQAL